MTLIEKILAKHAGKAHVKPGDIVDVEIDVRIARDFGGANVVKNLIENDLDIDDPAKTFFTFDTNPTGSDQKYAANQHFCRQFARQKGIKVYDINVGIGTHTAIEEGLAIPGSTLVSTDSHANIVGAVCAFGQGMGDQDIAAVWATGKAWFKVPPSVRLILKGKRPAGLTAKDIVLNLLYHFGANGLLGMAVEVTGDEVDKFTLDERITIASMATEMGAIILLFEPNDEVMAYCESRAGKKIEKLSADPDAHYAHVYELDLSTFVPMVSRPGHPDDSVDITAIGKIKIDSAFIGSCTNGRIEDLRIAASILNGRKVAPGVVLKIVPSTDRVWQQMMEEGLLKIFKQAGALVGNAGCAGCAAGQIGQNGPGEITISTGNRNFAGKQGKGFVYLASPAVVAASAVAGYITTPDALPERPLTFDELPATSFDYQPSKTIKKARINAPTIVEGKVWIIQKDNIDTDMIFHNRYLTITQIEEMGKYTFDNLEGWQDFAQKAEQGDIIFTGKNFGAGSSRQQAVDCFKSLGIQAILAQSFGAIYERNAINAALPVLTYEAQILEKLDLKQRDPVRINFATGEVENLRNGQKAQVQPFSEVQMAIYKRGGLLNKAL